MSGSLKWVGWPVRRWGLRPESQTGWCPAVIGAEYVAEGTTGFAAYHCPLAGEVEKASVPEAEKADVEDAGKNHEEKRRFGSG